jgi:imidazoleglycerol-phosphate dehydratase/histidinol-phosphatase
MITTKVAFINRDGTLIFKPLPPQVLKTSEDLIILPGVIEGLQRLLLKDYRLVMVSNQEGLGTRINPSKEFRIVQEELLGLFSLEGIIFHKVFVCPHLKKDWCLCRKPRTGLVDEYVQNETINYPHSLVIGNGSEDAEFARNMFLSFIDMELNGHFPSIPLT